MTLREMLTDAERITHDLVDHLDKNFIPRSRQLAQLVAPTESESFVGDIADITVRNHASKLVDSEDFTEQLYEKLAKYCHSIDGSASRILNED